MFLVGFYLGDARQREETCLAGFHWWDVWIETNEGAENARLTDKPEQFFGCRSPTTPFSRLHDVTDSSQCLTTARRHRRPPRGLSPPSLSMRPHPPHRRPPARPPPSAAGCPTAAWRPPAAQTHGAPSTESPSCFRSVSPGRRSPSSPETTHCLRSGSSSAPSWTRR